MPGNERYMTCLPRQRDCRTGTLLQRLLSTAFQGRVDGGAIFGELAAAVDRCRDLLGAAIQNDNRAGRTSIFAKELLKSQSFGFGPTRGGVGLIREVQDHKIHTP